MEPLATLATSNTFNISNFGKARAMFSFMRRSDWILSFGFVYFLGFLAGVAGLRLSAKVQEANNVNSRYTVEAVELKGIDENRLSSSLRDEIRRKIGKKFHPDVFAELALRIKQELHARTVSPKLERGTNIENVKVLLDVEPRRSIVEPNRSRIAYQSKQGLTGAGFIASESDNNLFRFGYLNNGEDTVERVGGILASYQRKMLDGRLRAAFQFETFNAKWDRSLTLATPDSPNLYNGRQTYSPALIYTPNDGVSLSTGFSFTNYNFSQASQVANLGRGSASHVLTSTLRLRRAWGEPTSFNQRLTGEYNTQFSTTLTGSDFDYRRQLAAAHYTAAYQKHQIETNFTTGRIDGFAPLNERFVAGNSRLLRGWNKLDLTPLGASRIVAGSIEYAFKATTKWMPAIFFDSGEVWSSTMARVVKNSAGAGIRSRDGFYLYVAFPIKEGRAEPQVMTGVNF